MRRLVAYGKYIVSAVSDSRPPTLPRKNSLETAGEQPNRYMSNQLYRVKFLINEIYPAERRSCALSCWRSRKSQNASSNEKL